MIGLVDGPSQVVRYLFIEDGLGTLPSASGAWPVHANRDPDAPDSAITVRNTEGKSDGRTMTDGEVQDHYGIQVRVRAAVDADGSAKANAIRNYMMTGALMDTVTVGTRHYLVHNFSGIGEVLYLGDEPMTKRQLYTINALATITQLD